ARITSANLAPMQEAEHTPLCVGSLPPILGPGGFRVRDSQPSVGLSVYLLVKPWKDIFVTLCEVCPRGDTPSRASCNRSRIWNFCFSSLPSYLLFSGKTVAPL